MKKKRNKRLNRILAVLIIVAAVCVGGYFAFCFWVNASGMIMGKDAKVDQGSAIVVNGAHRREGVFSLLICATDEEEKRTDSMMLLVFDTKNKRPIFSIFRAIRWWIVTARVPEEKSTRRMPTALTR